MISVHFCIANCFSLGRCGRKMPQDIQFQYTRVTFEAFRGREWKTQISQRKGEFLWFTQVTNTCVTDYYTLQSHSSKGVFFQSMHVRTTKTLGVLPEIFPFLYCYALLLAWLFQNYQIITQPQLENNFPNSFDPRYMYNFHYPDPREGCKGPKQ